MKKCEWDDGEEGVCGASAEWHAAVLWPNRAPEWYDLCGDHMVLMHDIGDVTDYQEMTEGERNADTNQGL